MNMYILKKITNRKYAEYALKLIDDCIKEGIALENLLEAMFGHGIKVKCQREGTDFEKIESGEMQELRLNSGSYQKNYNEKIQKWISDFVYDLERPLKMADKSVNWEDVKSRYNFSNCHLMRNYLFQLRKLDGELTDALYNFEFLPNETKDVNGEISGDSPQKAESNQLHNGNNPSKPTPKATTKGEEPWKKFQDIEVEMNTFNCRIKGKEFNFDGLDSDDQKSVIVLHSIIYNDGFGNNKDFLKAYNEDKKNKFRKGSATKSASLLSRARGFLQKNGSICNISSLSKNSFIRLSSE